MPETLDDVRFVVDENLLRFGKAVRALRRDLTCVGEPPVADLLPAGILDPDWIPIVGEHGWIKITNDKRLRTKPAEATLAIENHLKVIHLYGAGNLTAWEQTVRFASRWASIEKHVTAHPDGPWWLSVRLDAARVLAFQPGRAERADRRVRRR